MTAEHRTIADDPPLRSMTSAWSVHLAVLGALVAMLGAVFWRSITAAVQVWWVSPTFSHCFLIIPVSAYIVWTRREVLARQTPSAYPRALWLTVPVIAAALVGMLTAVNEIKQLAFMALVQIMILSLLGPRVYRTILFPSLFLFFLVPMGEYLIGPLQRFTTWFISAGLDALGILHYTEGNTIQLANGVYEVAEACAGLRFLIATIAVGAVFSYFTYRKWHKIALFILACMIVPVIANGFRALGIVLLAHYSDNKIATGTDHLVYGWGFSVAILALLMFIGMRFADPEAGEQAAETPAPQPRSLASTAMFAVLAIAVVPAFLLWRAQAEPAINRAAFSLPPAPAGWSLVKPSQQWQPLYAEPDARLAFAMQQADSVDPPVDVLVDYYAENDDGRSLITSTNKLWDEEVWHPVVQNGVRARLGDADIPLGEVEISNGTVSRLIWWTYASGGGFTTSGMIVKLNRLRSLGGMGASLVAVSTPMDSDLDAARNRLARALRALGGLRRRLGAAK
ncbi:MAG: EpsI family protein [Alphaproteobacteria bacterium]|nr:EpsI family protein [Alphaproteobacteria bacterium]